LLLKVAQDVDQAAAWLRLADLRVLRGDLARAVEAVDRAVEISLGTRSDDPAIEWSRLTPESRFGLGDVYIRAEKLETADRIIESLDDEPGFALLLRARTKLERGDSAGALADYQEAFRAFPSNPAARYLAGRAALEVGDFDLAISMYQDALRSDSAATDAGVVLGRMLLAEGKPNYAIDTLTFFLMGNEDEPHALRVLAQAGFATGNHAWAENVRARLANHLHWAGVALADQAKDLAVLNGVEAARDYLAKSPALEEPTHFEALSAWVGYANALGAGNEARERVRRLVEQSPDAAGFWIVWSRILYEDGDSKEAIDAIRRAIELNPMLATAPGELGMMLLAEGQVDEAVASFDRAAEIDPLDARAALSAAEGLLDAGREDEAEERLRKILIHHPWHGRAALLLVDIMRKRGPIDERTYQIARRAARMIGLSGPRAHYELGRIEAQRGSYEEALEAYGAALRANYDPPQVEFEMAETLVALDRGGEAIPLLEHALASENFQESVAALSLLEELRAEEQKQ
jgi:tetratricopeptide (TPR) repeat protein